MVTFRPQRKPPVNSGDTEFEEKHKGLEDVKIEIAIMAKCYKTHKKIENNVNSTCWRKVQNKRKEIDSRKQVLS